MIKSMIDLGIYEEAGEAITTLASFYRYSLSKGSDIITIGTEIEMVKQYLYIEKLRHMEYFDYEINCEKDAMQYVIPKLNFAADFGKCDCAWNGIGWPYVFCLTACANCRGRHRDYRKG